jgi:hypothetical protein
VSAKQSAVDPWTRFLEARAELIRIWFAEGRTSEEIARALSMDPQQPAHIMRAMAIQDVFK